MVPWGCIITMLDVLDAVRGHRGSNGVRLDREGSAVAAALRRMSAEHGSCSSQHALVAETKAVRQQEASTPLGCHPVANLPTAC